MADLFTEFDGWLGETKARLGTAWHDLEERVGDLSEELGTTAGEWQGRAEAELERWRTCLDDLFGEAPATPPPDAREAPPEGAGDTPESGSGSDDPTPA